MFEILIIYLNNKYSLFDKILAKIIKPYFDNKFCDSVFSIRIFKYLFWNTLHYIYSDWFILVRKNNCSFKAMLIQGEQTTNVLHYYRSQRLLSLSKEQLVDAVIKYVDVEPTKTSPITCASTIYKTSSDKQSVSCPILATEAGHVYVIDPKGFSILHQVIIKIQELQLSTLNKFKTRLSIFFF